MSNLHLLFDYEIYGEKIVGQGNFGTVVECKHKTKYQGEELCVKMISINSEIDQSLLQEIQILKKLKNCYNKHLILTYDIIEDQRKFYIFMQRCRGGDLKKLIDKRKEQSLYFKTEEVLDFIYQITDGYKTLMENNIIHRDIKPQNIFVDGSNYKIGDLGAGRILADVKTKGDYTKIGSPIYSSPQILHDHQYSNQTDIYSFGMVLYQLCFFSFPLEQTYTELMKFISQIKYNKFKIKKNLPNIGPKNEQEEIIFLLENMLVYDEEQRLDWNTLFARLEKNPLYSQFRGTENQNRSISQIQQKKQQNNNLFQHLNTQQLETSFIQFQIQFDSNIKKSPLSQFIRLQFAKYQLLDLFLLKFSQILSQNVFNIKELEYLLIQSSLFGYQRSLMLQIQAIHQGNMGNISQHILARQEIYQNNLTCIQTYQNLRTEQDIQQLNWLIELYNNSYNARNVAQILQYTIQQINKQKIRLQQLVDLRNLLEKNLIDCLQYSKLATQFCGFYLERKIIEIIINQSIEQLPEILIQFIVYYSEFQNLENTYPQYEFFKEVKIQRFPKLEWSPEENRNKLYQLKEKYTIEKAQQKLQR